MSIHTYLNVNTLMKMLDFVYFVYIISKYLFLIYFLYNSHQTIEIFHHFSPRNVTGANTSHKTRPPPNVHMTFLVNEIDICDASLNHKGQVNENECSIDK